MDSFSVGISAAPSQTPTAAPPAELTILTVGIEKHYGYIRGQIAMIDALNPGVAYRFLAVDNVFGAAPGLVLDDPRCTVLPGVDPAPLPEYGRGSYHHAAALNMALQHVTTRYVMVLDPDLFVIYRNWIDECLDHMKKNDLGFFGVPWHSRWYVKWRGFPCVHLMLIDLSKAPAGELDFTPRLVEDNLSDEAPASAWLKAHAPVLHTRMQIGTRRDTGWLIHRRFHHSCAVDCALPVVDLDNELTRPRHLQTDHGRWFERRLPRRWRFLPEPGSYVAPSDAPGFSSFAFRSLEPEKFVWRGAPFAFHMRRNVRAEEWGLAKQRDEEMALFMILDQISQGGPWVEWKPSRTQPTDGARLPGTFDG